MDLRGRAPSVLLGVFILFELIYLPAANVSLDQLRQIIDGLDADVATLALAGDTDALVKNGGWLAPDWQKRLPHNASPYTSTIVLAVREGNPKGIKDWDDLVKPGIGVITPNPKTSGGARWNYLAAWAFAKQKYGDDAKAREFVTKIYKNVPVLDSGARGSTTTFVQKKVGDVHLAWENEALLEVKEAGDLEVVYPPTSFLAEPPLAVVDANVDRKGTRAAAEAYLRFVYTDQGQEIAAKNFYRPTNAAILAKHASSFPNLKLFPVTAVAPSWDAAYKRFFSEGGLFDQIYSSR